MTYGKIDSQRNIMLMPNPIRITFANPTEEQKVLIAELDNWLECVYNECPPYDPTTQYATQYWVAEEVDNILKAVQHWEIHDIEEVEADE